MSVYTTRRHRPRHYRGEHRPGAKAGAVRAETARITGAWRIPAPGALGPDEPEPAGRHTATSGTDPHHRASTRMDTALIDLDDLRALDEDADRPLEVDRDITECV